MTTLYLDFDGVLFETAKESYLLARESYDGVGIFEPIDNSDFQLFRQYRFLVVDSWQYYFLWKIMRNHTAITKDNFISVFNTYIQRETLESKKFDQHFLQSRLRLSSEHHDFWLGLDEPFPFFEKIKLLACELANELEVLIISTKNEDAIKAHFSLHNFHLSQENIYGKQQVRQFRSKKGLICHLMQHKNISQAIFVDDNDAVIDAMQDIPNLICCQADWGYHSPLRVGMFSDLEIINTVRRMCNV